MALKIYGVARSRAFRTLWMAAELGLEYEHVRLISRGGTRQPAYLAINPNGHVPVIDDGGFRPVGIDGDQSLSRQEVRQRAAGLYPTTRGRSAGLAMELLGNDGGRTPGADGAAEPGRSRRASATRAPRMRPSKHSPPRSMCSMPPSPPRLICSATISPSPISTSPVFFHGRARRASTCRRFRAPRHGSRIATTDRPHRLRGRCNEDEQSSHCGLVALILTSLGQRRLGREERMGTRLTRRAALGSWAGAGPETLYQRETSNGG